LAGGGGCCRGRGGGGRGRFFGGGAARGAATLGRALASRQLQGKGQMRQMGRTTQVSRASEKGLTIMTLLEPKTHVGPALQEVGA
jgi:hypothetical protein